jgi:TP53 regulating kinase and related kinases
VKIYLIRHAESTADAEYRYGGEHNKHLSEKGIGETKSLAAELKEKGIQIIYSSPKLEAAETANIVAQALNVKVKMVDGLIEKNNYGILTGLTKAEAQQKYPDQVMLLEKGIMHSVKDSEGYNPFKKRVINSFIEITNEESYSSIAIVSHGGPIRCIIRELLKIGEMQALGDCAMITIEKVGDSYFMVNRHDMKRISEGAEAEIYETEAFGMPAILKDRISKAYRTPTLDVQIREQRTKSEARILARASSNGISTPIVLMINRYQIFMQKLNGRMLNSILESEKTGKKIESILANAGVQLGMLHMLDIIHGDYTPANIVADQSGTVSIIDFGLGEITNSLEGKALDVLLMKRSINKKLYSIFQNKYLHAQKRDGKAVLSRLAEIERRGRYQTRTLISKA